MTRSHKYVCVECKAESWFQRRERDRAAGLRCTACGSRFIEPAPFSVMHKRAPLAQGAARDAKVERRAKQGYAAGRTYDEEKRA